MTAPEWAVERALNEHRLGRPADFLRRYPAACVCGHVLPPDAGESVEGLLARHQAEQVVTALGAAGLGKTTVEWGVRHVGTGTCYPVNAAGGLSAEQRGRAEQRVRATFGMPRIEVVSREVTEWREVPL